MSIKELAVGGVITLVIGGSAYTVNKTDVATNFAEDTGMTQQQAENYVNQVSDEDLVPYDELGDDYVKDGQDILEAASEIDCINYEYDWESPSLSCTNGKSQLERIGNTEISLGQAFIRLASDAASESDISTAIAMLDKLNRDIESPIIDALYDQATISEIKNNNSYNKALLKTALQSKTE